MNASRMDHLIILRSLAAVALVLRCCLPMNARELPAEFYEGLNGHTFWNLKRHRIHTALQIQERAKHCSSDLNILFQTAQHLHPGAVPRDKIEAAYAEFESSLQKAGDDLETIEPPKSSWAAELISFYTRPTHRWPAVSPTLDKAVNAREQLVQFTNAKTVSAIEQKLYRFATPADKSHYYRDTDQSPSL